MFDLWSQDFRLARGLSGERVFSCGMQPHLGTATGTNAVLNPPLTKADILKAVELLEKIPKPAVIIPPGVYELVKEGKSLEEALDLYFAQEAG